MNKFSNKINLLKALAISVVVAGHLEFSLIPMFPPYSFQVPLFFFIAGMLFNPKYNFSEYFKKRVKSLLKPCFSYCAFYLILTALIAPVVGKFYGMPVTLKNELLMPFLTGHQLDLIAPLWFVPCLFITLMFYKIFSLIKCPKYARLYFYFTLALSAICFQKYAQNVNCLWIFRTMYALFFVDLGYFYKTRVEGKFNIFRPEILSFVLIFQSILWLTNKDFTPQDGIGLHFLLVWGQYGNPIVPILTCLTGIYISLFLIEISFDKIKNWGFLQKIGQNTMHIMANHLLIFNIFTYSLLALTKTDFAIKNNADVYWFYCPLKTTYFYFVFGMIITTYIGELLGRIGQNAFRPDKRLNEKNV